MSLPVAETQTLISPDHHPSCLSNHQSHHHHQKYHEHHYKKHKHLCQGHHVQPATSLFSNFTALALLSFLSLFLLGGFPGSRSASGVVSALSCEPCQQQICPNITDCLGGVVRGLCGCCDECAKLENETCGGPWGIYGKCDYQLQCFIQRIPGRALTGDEEGTCKEIKNIECNSTTCPPEVEEKLCPPDSYLVRSLSNTVPREDDDPTKDKSSHQYLSEHTSYCTCNVSSCVLPVCPDGQSPQLLQKASGLPGTCCDVYDCNATKEETEDCSSKICPPYEENLCPEDSTIVPPIWTADRCCQIQQGCVCPPKDECKPVWCPVGFQVQVLSRASRLPGSCCDRFRCVNESGLTCTYGGKERKNGEKWSIDKCKYCQCRDGLNKCRDKVCPKISCTWMATPIGECCPVCKGCVSDSGELHNNTAVWKENDYTTCKCVEGHAQCQSEFCSVKCANPKHIPGQPCPVCPETEADNKCKDLSNCNIYCSEGLNVNQNGCYECSCMQAQCDLKCDFGLKTDVEGNTMCECQSSDSMCNTRAMEDCLKQCQYGFALGTDGCPKCKCKKCPQKNCSKKCIYGHVVSDEGCEICKCSEAPLSKIKGPKANSEEIDEKVCFSNQGGVHEDGESWNDGCRVCYCHNGVEMCSLIACPAPRCLNPVFKVGDCCPTCPSIPVVSVKGERQQCQSSLGHYFMEGETWRLDECTHCICHGGTILCETSSCPPVLCHHPVKARNQCCATCPGKDLTMLFTGGRHRHCHNSEGAKFKHGSVWQSTPCQSCMCQDGQLHCYNQICPPLNCNKTLLKKDQCCPTCEEIDKPKICAYKGVVYNSGERWQGDNCTKCLCSHGNTECFPLPCQSLNCSVMILPKGQCCPVCYVPSKKRTKELRNLENVAHNEKENDGLQGNIIGFSVLGLLLVVLAVVVVVLVYYHLKYRKQKHFRNRPKSINLELQGQMPFLPDSQPKSVNVSKQYLEKLCPELTSDKSKSDRASNHYTEINFGGQK